MVFGKNDIVVDEEESQQQVKPFGVKDTVVTETAEAMGAPVKGEKKVVQLPPKEPTKVEFKDLTKKENLDVIRNYAQLRFGDVGKQEKNESDQDYVKRWMRSMRQVEFNTTLNAVPELNWIYNAKPNEVLAAAAAHQLYERVPDFYEKGGQGGIMPVLESVAALATDPTTYAGFGIGAAARYKAAREGIKVALKDRLKAATLGAAVEAPLAVGSSAVQQQIKVETGVQEEISGTELAVAGTLGAVFGGLEGATAVAGKVKSTKADLEQALAAKKKPMPADKATETFQKEFDADLEKTLNEFDIFEGRRILDEELPPTPLAEGQVRKDINRKAIDVAKYVMVLDPTFRPQTGQKVSDAVKNVFMSMDTDAINDAVLDASLKQAGITASEFAQAARTTVADAATVMQGYSALARSLRRLGDLDPEAQKIIDAMYGKSQDSTSAMGYLGSALNRLERESKAFVVSSIGTTVRNVIGTTGSLTMDSAARLMEGTLYTTGKTLKAAATGNYTKGDFTRGLRDTVKDTFGTLAYMANAGLSAELTDKLLTDNPVLREHLLKALQESGEQDLSKAARFVNTLNVAQDAFFRRAIFNASVERQLRNVGMNVADVLGNNQKVPPTILQNAIDDALKGTFSYMPKTPRKGQQTLEAKAEGLGNQFVKFFENLPGGSLVVTFPRFMTNAMAFQYRYSPLGAASGINDMATAALTKDPVKAERLMREGVERFSRGTVGMAGLYAAYKYRMENQDTEWYNIKGEDGGTVDIRAIFPIGPYLAVGDFIAKMKQGKESEAKVSEMLSTIMGMKLPAGAQATFLDSLPELITSTEGKEAEKLQTAIGKVMGDFAGRFIQPGQPLFAYFDMFDRDAQVARDPNVVEGDSLVTEAAMNRIKAKVPELKEELPEAVRYLREETPIRGGEFFNLLIGMRVTPRANEIEREFSKLSLNPYTFFGASGDRTYDRAVIKNSGEYIQGIVGDLIKSDRYTEMTSAQKKLAVAENMHTALQIGRAMTEGQMLSEDIARVNKLTFNKLPQAKRKAINELYAEENEGRTMDQDEAYDRVHEYEAKIQQFR